MQKQLIESIQGGKEPLDDELFLAIFEIEDLVERQRFIEAARNKCREEKKLTEFNGMLRAWTAKDAQNRKQQGSNKVYRCAAGAKLRPMGGQRYWRV